MYFKKRPKMSLFAIKKVSRLALVNSTGPWQEKEKNFMQAFSITDYQFLTSTGRKFDPFIHAKFF